MAEWMGGGVSPYSNVFSCEAAFNREVAPSENQSCFYCEHCSRNPLLPGLSNWNSFWSEEYTAGSELIAFGIFLQPTTADAEVLVKTWRQYTL